MNIKPFFCHSLILREINFGESQPSISLKTVSKITKIEFMLYQGEGKILQFSRCEVATFVSLLADSLKDL